MAVAKRPFWMHQMVEYILGVALIASGLQSPTPIVPGVLGLLIIVNAAITKGPVGAFRVISKKVHRVVDVFVIVLDVRRRVPAVARHRFWRQVDRGLHRGRPRLRVVAVELRRAGQAGPKVVGRGRAQHRGRSHRRSSRRQRGQRRTPTTRG